MLAYLCYYKLMLSDLPTHETEIVATFDMLKNWSIMWGTLQYTLSHISCSYSFSYVIPISWPWQVWVAGQQISEQPLPECPIWLWLFVGTETSKLPGLESECAHLNHLPDSASWAKISSWGFQALPLLIRLRTRSSAALQILLFLSLTEN